MLCALRQQVRQRRFEALCEMCLHSATLFGQPPSRPSIARGSWPRASRVSNHSEGTAPASQIHPNIMPESGSRIELFSVHPGGSAAGAEARKRASNASDCRLEPPPDWVSATSAAPSGSTVLAIASASIPVRLGSWASEKCLADADTKDTIDGAGEWVISPELQRSSLAGGLKKANEQSRPTGRRSRHLEPTHTPEWIIFRCLQESHRKADCDALLEVGNWRMRWYGAGSIMTPGL